MKTFGDFVAFVIAVVVLLAIVGLVVIVRFVDTHLIREHVTTIKTVVLSHR